MKSISYAASTQLRESLQKIDDLRKDILLTTLTPEQELRFRWQATIERVFWTLSFSESPLNKSEIAKLLKEPQDRQLTSPQEEALAYKKTYDYIAQELIGLQEPVSPKIVIHLYKIAFSGRMRINEEALRSSLLYFQNSTEHPIIQAGLIHFQTLSISPFAQNNDKLARLLSYLFLCKEGFYCRGLLFLEEYFKRNLIDYQQILKQTMETETQTLWLEYFAKATEEALGKILEALNLAKKNRVETSNPSLKLNERQKEILTILENPETTITNRQIQKMFKVSPITASRDLAKLTLLGLLFIHGKGRSVCYAKI